MTSDLEFQRLSRQDNFQRFRQLIWVAKVRISHWIYGLRTQSENRSSKRGGGGSVRRCVMHLEFLAHYRPVPRQHGKNPEPAICESLVGQQAFGPRLLQIKFCEPLIDDQRLERPEVPSL